MKLRVLALLACGALLACASSGERLAREVALINAEAAASGSPYRLSVESVGGGSLVQKELIGEVGGSVASALLRDDIFRHIANGEETDGGRLPPVLHEVRHVPAEPPRVTEIWVVQREKITAAYVVHMTPASDGGTDLHIQGPWK